MNYSKYVEEKIINLPQHRIFISSEFYNENCKEVPEKTYYKILERLVKKNIIDCLARGLYYRTKKTSLGNIPLYENEIVDFFSEDEQGVLIGYKLFNKYGLTTQISKKIEMYSNRQSETIKHIKNIEIKKFDIEFNELNIKFIECLEILQNYNKIEDFDKDSFFQYIKNVTNYYDNSCLDHILHKKKYKASTIAFLKNILDYFKIENNLQQYLSALSQYKIPLMEELYGPTSI